MKQIVNYINEKLHITSKQQYSCQPKTKEELRGIIIQRIEDDGHECNLNDIDVSKITDMSHLFDAGSWGFGNKIFKDFNSDISLWNVSNVTTMSYMFNKCEKFNGDISLWNVSNVTDMWCMFNTCEKFNCDLSQWNVSNVTNMYCMFEGCKQFNSDLSNWDVSNVENMGAMFYGCEQFNQNLNEWDVSHVTNMQYAFEKCPTQPKWYINNKL
jgi:surface protein